MAEMRSEIGKRLERNERDRARHRFADRIIEFAVANSTVELPDLLVERELEVMIDELKVRLAEQRIGYEDYLRATERDEAQLIESFRPDAEKRVKTLLVLGEIAEKENIDVSDAELEAELDRSRRQLREQSQPRYVPGVGARSQLHPFAACAAQRPSRR